MMRRTTVTAADEDFVVLEGEARRRGVSLAAVLREAVTEKAESVRIASPRPRYPLFASGDGTLSEQSWMDEGAPYRDA